MFKIKHIRLEDFKRFPLSSKKTFEHTFTGKTTMITGMNGSGKAQPLTSLVRTPYCWKTMKDIAVGSEVISKDGSICKVIAIHDHGKKDVYKLTFMDGRVVRATGDHLWKVYNHISYDDKVERVITTAEIEKHLLHNKHTKPLYIDLIDSENSPKLNLGIDFYAFGNLLCRHNYYNHNPGDDLYMRERCRKSLSGVKIEAVMTGYGLMFKRLEDRFIPDCFMAGSTSQRYDLLNGIMDVIGYVNDAGDVLADTVSKELAESLVKLVRSLGGMSYYVKDFSCLYDDVYNVNVILKNDKLVFATDRKNCNTSYNDTDLRLRIVNVELDGYEEVRCISIDHPSQLYVTDHYTVTHNSSLFNELTPLPSDRSDFGKSGYKELCVEFDRNEFTLICDFRDKPSYSFLMNGEELNTANNISTQRELVEKYFGITNEIHELLVGKNSFTDMSLVNRKKLFNAITHLNIDVVLEHYSKLKEEMKVYESNLKLHTSLLIAEEDKLKDLVRVENLRKEIEELNKHVEALFTLRGTLSTHTVNKSITDVYEAFKRHVDQLNSFRNKHYTLLTSHDRTNIPSLISDTKLLLKLTINVIDSILIALTEKDQELKMIEVTEQVNSLGYQEERNKLIEEISRIVKELKYLPETINIEELKHEFYKLESTLPEVLYSIDTNEDRRYSRENYDKLLTDKETLLKELMELSSLEIKLTKELKELEHTQDTVNCPSCNYSWSLSNIVEKTKDIEKELTKVINDKLITQNKLEKINPLLEKFVEYFQRYRQFSGIRNSTLKSLADFWKEVDTKELIFTYPRGIQKVMSDFLTDIRHIENIAKKKLRLKEIEDTLELFKKTDKINKLSILKEVEQYNSELQERYERKNFYERRIAELERAEKVFSYMDRLKTAFEVSRSDLFSVNISTAVSDLIKLIDDDLMKTRYTLLEKTKELNQQENTLEIINKYKTAIEETKENIKVLNILLTELSPKNGLIAKTVSSFLNIIISNVNNTINSIWNYRMILKPIDIDSESLNYKFKVEVEDKFTIEDTRLCSSGMKEAINFSFIVVLYRLLKLNNYPLFLDELGSNMDKDHTNNMVTMIQKLSQSDRFSQIFLITHKENFSHLNNVDVISLDE